MTSVVNPLFHIFPRAAWYTLAAPCGTGACRLEPALESPNYAMKAMVMDKRLLSTALLLLIGVIFAILSFAMIIHAKSGDDIIQGMLYAIPSLAAFGALIALPFRQAP